MQPDATSFPFAYTGLHTGIKNHYVQVNSCNGENTGLKIADGLCNYGCLIATVINITLNI